MEGRERLFDRVYGSRPQCKAVAGVTVTLPSCKSKAVNSSRVRNERRAQHAIGIHPIYPMLCNPLQCMNTLKERVEWSSQLVRVVQPLQSFAFAAEVPSRLSSFMQGGERSLAAPSNKYVTNGTWGNSDCSPLPAVWTVFGANKSF